MRGDGSGLEAAEFRARLFDDLKAAGGFVKRADGEIFDMGFCLTPGFESAVE